MHFMQKDQGNKVTEEDYMSAIIMTMRERPSWEINFMQAKWKGGHLMT